MKNFMLIWKEFFAEKKSKFLFISAVIYLGIVLYILPRFLEINENRNGVSFADPILSLFSPVDVTRLTFSLVYGGLLIAVFILLKHPRVLTTAFLSYAFLVTFRIAAMYSLPLNPPADTIPLLDPFVRLFGSGKVLTKDLFFSGHTATMFLLFLVMPNKKMKSVFLAGSIIMGIAVLIQHVHYSIDVIAAPFFAYAAYRISKLLIERFSNDKID